MKICEVVEPIQAWHGSSGEITGAFRPSARGRFGPGIYSSMQPGVADAYGKRYPVSITAHLFDAYPRFLMSDDRVRMRQQMFALMNPQEQAKVAEWWPENKGMMTGEDVWEIISRRLGPERAVEVLRQMGYEGITGIGDGQEINVFDPHHIRMVDTHQIPS